MALDPIHAFYFRKEYLSLAQACKVASGGVCARCGEVFEICDLRPHHIIELTLDNLDDVNITLNPKNIEVQEFEAAAVPRMLADVDLAIINSNYALQAGVEVVGTAIATESSDIAYPNIIAIREGDDRAELKTLVEVLQSEEMVQWIKDTYGTSVVPTK